MGGKIEQTPEQVAWLKERMGSIGASEAAAVLGLHPWLSPIQVWISKVHPELVEPRDNFLLRHGTYMEPVIAHHYEDETHRKLIPGGRFTHPKHPMISASPDRLVAGEPRAVELKTCNEFAVDKFGDFGSTEVPEAYLVQAWVQIEVCPVETCDIAAMLGGSRFGIYPIPQDKEVQQSIVEQLCEWWDHYVVARKEPPIDATEGWSDYIIRRYPTHGAGMMKVNEAEHPEVIGWVQGYTASKAKEEKEKSDKELFANRIKEFIGEHDGLLLPGEAKITWKKDKDSTADVTDWHLAWLALCQEFQIPPERASEILKENTRYGVVTRQGSRKFIYKGGK